jgi:cysteine-rich repeat protein
VCGNGVLEGGEECDDGNTTVDDGCDATCRSEMIPGSGVGHVRRDCFHEWLAPPVSTRDLEGRPSRTLHCTEGDPACDYDGAADGVCTFHVALCFNVNDRRTHNGAAAPACSPSNIERVRVQTTSAFRDGRASEAIEARNQQALESALGGLGAVVRGRCINDEAPWHRLCIGDADCETSPGRGDGTCRGQLLAFLPALADADRCTDMVDVAVPLRTILASIRAAKTVIHVKAAPAADPSGNGRSFSDVDVLRLYCDPP